jgi:predicted SprT family Zn-dependent metalloprotease
MKKPAARSYDQKPASKPTSITGTQYASFQRAYAWLNQELFSGQLPDVLVTLNRKANSRGYFHAKNFRARSGPEKKAHELALNPDHFTGRTDKEILSTLAHEMAHVWQEEHGKQKPSGGYHNREWAAKMLDMGLKPHPPGKPDQIGTGQKVTHTIIPGGPYDKAAITLLAGQFALQWQSAPRPKNAKAKAASKTKYTCQGCGTNAWAKPHTSLICGNCHSAAHGEEMQPE